MAGLGLGGLAGHLVVRTELAELGHGLVVRELKRHAVLGVKLVGELDRVLNGRVSAAQDELRPVLALDGVLGGDVDALSDGRRSESLEREVGEELPPDLVDRVRDLHGFRLDLLQVLLLVVLGLGAAVVLSKVRLLQVRELLQHRVWPVPRRNLARGQHRGRVGEDGTPPCRRLLHEPRLEHARHLLRHLRRDLAHHLEAGVRGSKGRVRRRKTRRRFRSQAAETALPLVRKSRMEAASHRRHFQAGEISENDIQLIAPRGLTSTQDARAHAEMTVRRHHRRHSQACLITTITSPHHHVLPTKAGEGLHPGSQGADDGGGEACLGEFAAGALELTDRAAS